MNVEKSLTVPATSLLQHKLFEEESKATEFCSKCLHERLSFKNFMLDNNLLFFKPKTDNVAYIVRKKNSNSIRFFIDLNKILGTGTSKIVRAYYNLDKGKEVAFGEINREGNHVQNAQREFILLKELQSRSKYFLRPKFWISSLEGLEGENPIMAMECIKGTFIDLLRKERPSYSQRVGIFKQILSGIAALHEMGYAHRDIKFENIFYTIDERGKIIIKIGDLGLACKLEGDEERKSKIAGSALYLSPESCRACTEKQPYDLIKSDSWGIGLIAYALFKNDRPEHMKNARIKKFNVLQIIHQNASLEGVSGLNTENPIEAIVDKMLKVNPEDRVSARNALILLNKLIFESSSSQRHLTSSRSSRADTKGQRTQTPPHKPPRYGQRAARNLN